MRTHCVQGGGSKIGKFLRTYFMDGPLALVLMDNLLSHTTVADKGQPPDCDLGSVVVLRVYFCARVYDMSKRWIHHYLQTGSSFFLYLFGAKQKKYTCPLKSCIFAHKKMNIFEYF